MITGGLGFIGNNLSIRLAEALEVFGDGRQPRDPVYVDDAVEAFLLAGSVPQLLSRAYNVGGLETWEQHRIAETLSDVAGCPEPADLQRGLTFATA